VPVVVGVPVKSPSKPRVKCKKGKHANKKGKCVKNTKPKKKKKSVKHDVRAKGSGTGGSGTGGSRIGRGGGGVRV
jgi:hypothetical protein